jgi:predicted nucleotidyltransferase
MEKINYKNKDKIIQILKRHKKELCNKYGIKEIGLFGSFVRGEESAKSDIDILVEYKENINRTLFDEARLIGELEEILKEENIDLAIKKNLNKYYKDNILKEVLYA